MARDERTDRQKSFMDQPADFNEQMYNALKSAPWWMMSIGFHVLIVVISMMFTSEKPLVPPTTAMTTYATETASIGAMPGA